MIVKDLFLKIELGRNIMICWFSVAISMADYVGSILSYIIVAIPIFSGIYEDTSSSDLSAVISAVRTRIPS